MTCSRKALGFAFALVAALALQVASLVHAGTFPDRQIHIIVPYPPGGAGDILTRDIGKRLAERTGVGVVVENRAGGNQLIAVEALRRAPADGYTLLLGSITSMALNPHALKSLPYEPERDLSPVSLLFVTPLVFEVNPELPVRTVDEFIEYAKTRPGSINYASVGVGSSLHLAAELLQNQTGIRLNHVPYKGSAQAVPAVVSGEVHAMFDVTMNSLAFIGNGRLRALAVTSEDRLASLPDVPTASEAGLADFNVSPWFGLVAASGTPKDRIDRLSREIRAILEDPELRRTYSERGIELRSSSPEEFRTLASRDSQRWGRIMKEAGIAPQ